MRAIITMEAKAILLLIVVVAVALTCVACITANHSKKNRLKAIEGFDTMPAPEDNPKAPQSMSIPVYHTTNVLIICRYVPICP
jgi:hypothetical protein